MLYSVCVAGAVPCVVNAETKCLAALDFEVVLPGKLEVTELGFGFHSGAFSAKKKTRLRVSQYSFFRGICMLI